MPTFARTATTETAETPRTPVQPRRTDDATTQNITRERSEPTTQDINKPSTSTVTPPTAAQRKPITVANPVTPVTPVSPATPATPAAVPVATRRPRASLLATLGLIVSVAGIALVLSGPLAGWGIGVAGLGLVLSLAGLSATRKQHVAGKTDALIGVVVALGAIVLGILALEGQIYWLGTDTQPATSLREWLDAQFANRF
ncbi:hypothetical protein Apa02nite_014660 [Actinoplanes palleronii]|uniref:Thrombospondin n=1 Tax=Actinoplanes palleronii TaxID=113570 RepID=A0ABQ4B3X1_9ACTN|nr:hypothetical protein Apa02nite_014660 [Actinoplanes palleronii]